MEKSIKIKRRWTDEDELFLSLNYTHAEEHVLTARLSRSWDAIKLKARHLGLHRSHDFVRNSMAGRLLEKTDEASYWLGFLLADGHFSKTGRIRIALALKDQNHLYKLSNFVRCPNVHIYEDCIELAFQNKDVCKSLSDLYQITNNKTKSPPDLSSYSDELLFALFIGFFDGDGSVCKRKYGFYGRIKCHKSWLSILVMLKTRLNIQGSDPRLNSRGYAEWHISTNSLRKLKQQARTLDMPVLARKWDKVHERGVYAVS